MASSFFKDGEPSSAVQWQYRKPVALKPLPPSYSYPITAIKPIWQVHKKLIVPLTIKNPLQPQVFPWNWRGLRQRWRVWGPGRPRVRFSVHRHCRTHGRAESRQGDAHARHRDLRQVWPLQINFTFFVYFLQRFKAMRSSGYLLPPN